MQIFLDRDLLAAIRDHDRPLGFIQCDVTSSNAFIARSIVGQPDTDAVHYPLAIDLDTSRRQRIPFLLADPPSDRQPPWELGPTPSLAPDRGATILGHRMWRVQAGFQPYIQMLLTAKSDLVLLVGLESVAFVRRRPALNVQSAVWVRHPTTLVPVQLPSVGTNPLLTGSRVAVAGLGGIGSQIAEMLAAAGVKHLVLVDPDTLELRNLRRHMCGVEYLGLPKVDAVTTELARLGYQTTTTAIPTRVQAENADLVRSRFSDCDVAFCCTDSAASRQFVNHWAVTTGKPAVIVDVQLRPQPLGEVVTVVPGAGGCFNCWRMEMERSGLLIPSKLADGADYPVAGPTAPSGVPMHQLIHLAAVACDFGAISRTKGAIGMLWLMAMDGLVDDFDDIGIRRPALDAISRDPDCRVCAA